MSHRHLTLLAGLALAAGGALAQGTYHEDERNANQEARIQQGEADGTITPREGAQLQRQQHQIRRAERHAAANGDVSPAERARIQRMQNHASRSIERKEDNAHVSH
jgi:uncharacterized membrane protein YebE (DUF533 family)